MHCADTSFLLSYYGEDANSEQARTFLASATEPLHVHALNDFELSNALRGLVFRGVITTGQRTLWLADYQSDKSRGILVDTILDANAALRGAQAISEERTESSGNRSYDILLVASAILLGATHFWSFDTRQRDLAKTEGMIAMP